MVFPIPDELLLECLGLPDPVDAEPDARLERKEGREGQQQLVANRKGPPHPQPLYVAALADIDFIDKMIEVLESDRLSRGRKGGMPKVIFPCCRTR